MSKLDCLRLRVWIAAGCLSLLQACSSEQDLTPQQQTAKDSSSSQSIEKPARKSIPWPDKYEPTQVDMSLIQVTENTYYVQGPPGTPTDNDGFMSNAGVVVTEQGVVVFDALGTPSLAFKLLTLIREITDKPVIKVVVSHYHADHIYGLQVFKEHGAEIIAPQGAKIYLESPAAEGRLKQRRETLFPFVDENTYIVKPDRYISKDTQIDLGSIKLSLLVLGSTHSQGDLMMRVEPDGVLYSGDLIFEGRLPFVAGSSPELWLQRLSTFETSTVKHVVPGHGPAPGTVEGAVTFTKTYLELLHNSMGEAVENLMSFEEAYDLVDWSAYKDDPAFMANRTNAYFVYLRLEAQSMQ